jgi:hypothetical protein
VLFISIISIFSKNRGYGDTEFFFKWTKKHEKENVITSGIFFNESEKKKTYKIFVGKAYLSTYFEKNLKL